VRGTARDGRATPEPLRDGDVVQYGPQFALAGEPAELDLDDMGVLGVQPVAPSPL
jgi:hypothetical protein